MSPRLIAPLLAVCLFVVAASRPQPTERYYEGERYVPPNTTARVQEMRHFGPHWSGDAHYLWHGKTGEAARLDIPVRQSGRYAMALRFTHAPDYGIFEFQVDGKTARKDIDTYDPKVVLAPELAIGEFQLDAGRHRLTLTLTGANPKSVPFRDQFRLLGLDYVKLTRLDPPAVTEKPSAVPPPPLITLAEARGVMKEHCFGCHGDKKTKGKVHLERLATKAQFLKDIELTRTLVDVLENHEMPPEDEAQPGREVRQELVHLFSAYIDEYLRDSKAMEPIVMRRLNRYEYNNAVKDLLRLKGDIYPLPEKIIRPARPYFDPGSGLFPDSVRVGNRTLGKFQVEQQILAGVVPFAMDPQAEHGFNNRGDELSISPLLLESFLKLGRSILTSPQFPGYCGIYKELFEPLALGDDLDDAEKSKRQVAAARERLRTLLDRAFRRPADPATLDRYARFFEREYEGTGSFPGSMKSAVAGILASPRFLFQMENKRTAESVEALDDFELASRLSFFLWSSIPDDALLERARAGKLTEPEALEAEVRRMLMDPRSKALSENFARQWMRLDQLITAVPDMGRFPTYYSRIGCEYWKFGLQMMVEPLLLFESIMVEDLSILRLVDSDYSYRSDELQTWYDSADPFAKRDIRNRFNTFQQDFTRRNLDTRREGGVMTSAAVLTMTSSPLRTSPIIRGAWVATVMFNKPPPPPPDVVPEIEADDAAIEAQGLTLRQRLKQHQSDESCASCHSRIDPLGFALENFDAVGRWRDTYRSGLPIDASGKLFGEQAFKDVVGLKEAMLARPEIFITAMAEHMLSYALGRELTIDDRPAIRRIARRVQADGGRFSTLVVEIAKSRSFCHKSNQAKTEQTKP